MTTPEELLVYANSRNGLGIRILGAKRATGKSAVFIKQILDDGLAQKDGRLRVGDQILSINDESVSGINREQAVNILRSAAASNQVRLRVKHFSASSAEFQKLLYEEKSTDDDEDNNNNNSHHHPHRNNDLATRKSSRKHHQARQTIPNAQQTEKNSSLKGLDVSSDALQALLNSRFQIIDLVDLLKKTQPKSFPPDQKREVQFIEQLSQSNADGRITLKDFERQCSVLLGERINLLLPFHSSSSSNSQQTDLQRELASCRSTIDELQSKVQTCEKSQRLSNEIEYEYEDLLKFVYEQLRQNKLTEQHQLKQLRKNDQLIRKLFSYLSSYVSQSDEEHLLAQLKYEYEQQQKSLLNSQQTTNKDPARS